MIALTVARAVGLVVGLVGIAMIRREREDAADRDRRVRPRVVAVWVAVAVVGAAVTAWAIFAS